MLVGLVVVGDVIWITRLAEIRVRGPGTGGTVEAHGLVAVQVTDIENLARIVGRLVMPHGAAAAGLALVRIPVEGGGETPVLVVTILVGQGDRRLGRSEEHTSELQSRP